MRVDMGWSPKNCDRKTVAGGSGDFAEYGGANPRQARGSAQSQFLGAPALIQLPIDKISGRGTLVLESKNK